MLYVCKKMGTNIKKTVSIHHLEDDLVTGWWYMVINSISVGIGGVERDA